MSTVKQMKWAVLLVSMLFLFACGGGGSDSASSGTTGTLSLSMIDASDDSYESVYVTIKEVQVCREEGDTGEWITVATLNETYDLLTLVGGVMATLGQKELEPGTYNQMRLILGNEYDESQHPYPQYLIDKDQVAHELKVPSGYQTGIKLVSQFEIVENLTTELILDFDVSRSIHLAGQASQNGGKYILKPTIKVIGTHNRAVVSGIVTDDAAPGVPQVGAMVTAWQSENGVLSVSTSTLTNENGEYTLYLDLGGDLGLSDKEYTLVTTLNGYDPDCLTLTVAVDQTYPDTDFILSPTAETVTVSGTVTGTIAASALPEGETSPTVHISFQKDCDTVPVEFAFTDTTDDADDTTADVYYNTDGTFQYKYEIILPAGEYDVVASTQGLTSAETPVNASASTTLNITFP